MFAAPVLVLASTGFAHPMNLAFNTLELVAIISSVLIVNRVVAEGEGNWFEVLPVSLSP